MKNLARLKSLTLKHSSTSHSRWRVSGVHPELIVLSCSISRNNRLIQLSQHVNAQRLTCWQLLPPRSHGIARTFVRTTMTGPVLIIEDEPDIAEVLRYSLEKAGFNTRSVLTGEEGLNASLDRTNPPSLILLDLLLPGMNGLELCRRLRNEPATQRTPIVIITAKALPSDIRTSLHLGANDYFTKPFSVREVVGQVRSLLLNSEGQSYEHISLCPSRNGSSD